MDFRGLFLRVRALVAPHHVERKLDEEFTAGPRKRMTPSV